MELPKKQLELTFEAFILSELFFFLFSSFIMGPKSEKSTFSEALGCRLQLNTLLGQCAVDSKGMKYKTA